MHSERRQPASRSWSAISSACAIVRQNTTPRGARVRRHVSLSWAMTASSRCGRKRRWFEVAKSEPIITRLLDSRPVDLIEYSR